VRRDYNLEWRAGSLCVLVNGDNEAAATGDRITKIRVRDGSIRNDPTVLPESICKAESDGPTVVFGVHEGHDDR